MKEMEQGKGTKSSSSSPSELSGSKVPPSSKSRLLDALFPSETKSVAAQMQDSLNEILDRKPRNSSNPSNGNEGESRNVAVANRKVGPVFQENCIPPCTLSSSIYYGGQEDYPLPKTNQGPVYNYNDDDESEYAIRGNWWKGSFYY